jgi:GMP synthase (glutamine-hydrolysing)
MGSQTDHLIMQIIAKQRVFCLPADSNSVTADDVIRLKPKGIFLSGSPASVYDGTVSFDTEIFSLGIPVLGICYGAQLIAKYLGMVVKPAQYREFGTHECWLSEAIDNELLKNIPKRSKVVQNHGDHIVPNNTITVLGTTENSVAVFAHKTSLLYGVQFHPEVSDTEYGERIFHNFISFICNAKHRFPVVDIAEEKIKKLAEEIDGKVVLLALSGGSDSSVCAYLLHEAQKRCPNGAKIHALYIKGVDRPEDEAYVRKFFGNKDLVSLNVVDATEDMLEVLKGKTTSKEKRAIFRDPYKEKLEEEIKRIGADCVVQGTLYTDISESGIGYETEGTKAVIKQHHNVNLKFSVPEIMPLADLVKDNARDLGRRIGVPEVLLSRHPFPGPGNAIRVLGEVTEEKLAIVKHADAIVLEELHTSKEYDNVWQAGAVVTDSKSTCQKGDGSSSGWVVAFFAVNSVNGFTAQFSRLPWSVIDRISKRIMNEIPGVGRVVYNVSDKPGATIEWE